LVKELIELHGGSIGIESKEGVATVVTISFPRERVINTANNVAA
jgi:signal transduction histidine kinase